MPTLRTPNNPHTDTQIMGVLKKIMLVDPSTGQPNTQLGINQQNLGSDLVFIQQKYKMSLLLTQSSPIALHLSSGHQSYKRAGQSTWDGSLSITAAYYSRWDNQDDTIDNIWDDIAADLELIKANIEDNDSTAYGSTNNTMSIPQILLDPYEGEFDKTFTGLTLVYRRMIIVYNLLPYR